MKTVINNKYPVFPGCSVDCEAVKILGASECYNVCPYKFNEEKEEEVCPACGGSGSEVGADGEYEHCHLCYKSPYKQIFPKNS